MECGEELLAVTNTLVVNGIELEQLAGKAIDIDSDQSLFEAAHLLTRHGVETVVVTLGRKGVCVLDRGQKSRMDAHRVAAVDTTGAGDCFIGGYTAGLLSNRGTLAAVALGNAAAAISVTRKGAGSSMPSLSEVMALYGDDIRQAGTAGAS